jgi:hypothetical protein
VEKEVEKEGRREERGEQERTEGGRRDSRCMTKTRGVSKGEEDYHVIMEFAGLFPA